MSVRRSSKWQKLLQYAERVWGIVDGTEEERVNEAIASTRNFFESVGVRTRLSDYGIGRETIPIIVERLEKRRQVALGEQQDVNPQVVEEILQLCG